MASMAADTEQPRVRVIAREKSHGVDESADTDAADAAGGTAARIARAVARGNGAHGRIYRRDLVEFFSCAATSFGQASDGQREAAALLRLLVPRDERSRVDGEVSILERVFAEYLARRFSSHPAHLDELAHIIADLGRLRGGDEGDTPSMAEPMEKGNGSVEHDTAKTHLVRAAAAPPASIAASSSSTAIEATAELTLPSASAGREEAAAAADATHADDSASTAELHDTINRLREQVAAQDLQIKSVTEHHQRVLSAALNAARIERTKALNSGLADLSEKVKRLSTERLKRDAQIARLRAQISEARSSHPPASPVVSRSRRSPGRLSSPGRIRPGMPTTGEASAIDDVFTPLPKVGVRLRRGRALRTRLREGFSQSSSSSIASSKHADRKSSGRKEESDNNDGNRGRRRDQGQQPLLWWENASLSDALSTSGALELYDLAQKQMRMLSEISVGSAEDVSLSVDGDRSGSNRDTAASVERVAAAMRLKDAAMQYHGEQAILLAANASSRAAASKDRLLRAKSFVEMAQALDMTHDFMNAITYAERAVRLFNMLGLDAREVSASLHVMLLCCEMQDLDKAEVTAMKVKELRGTTPSIRQQLDDHLETIRSAIEHGMRVKVDRTQGWPCKVLLDADVPVAV